MVVAQLPADLGEDEVRAWVGQASFARGEGYFLEGRIIAPRIDGNVLSASCQGTRALPYDVEVLLGREGIAAAHCSCPVGGEGRCKHVAALLLTWIRQPNAVTRQEEILEGLQRRSKAELIWLILRMLRRHPDLEVLLRLPVPGASEEDDPAYTEVVEQAVHDAFVASQGDGALVAHSVRQFVDLADAHLSHGNKRLASSVYEAIVRIVMARYDEVYDEHWDLLKIVVDCALGLARCLSQTDNANERWALLRTLFELRLWHLSQGGYDLGNEIDQVFLSLSDPGERRRLADWAWEALPGGAGYTSEYARRDLGELILALLGDELSDEEYLTLSHEAGLWQRYTQRLLDLGRVNDAVEAIRRANDYQVLRLADLLCDSGHRALAREVVTERLGGAADTRLMEWLQDRAAEDGDPAEALRLAERIFWQHPSLERLEKVRVWAERLDAWPELREGIVTRLAAEGRYALLTRVHLAEKDIERALEAFAQVRSGGGRLPLDSLQLEVADALQTERPRIAARLYLEYAEARIKARGRGNYAEAVRYLRRVRKLLRRMDAEDEWTEIITRIREDNRRLRAFQEELDGARL